MSKLLHFNAYANGESEIIKVQLSQTSKARTKIFEYDFADLGIKGRTSKGNLLSRYPVRKVSHIRVGKSTLGAMKFWMDEVSGRINTSDRGLFLGAFDTGELLLVIYTNGTYVLMTPEETHKFEVKDVAEILKFSPNLTISTVYYDGERKESFVKRFQIDTTTLDKPFSFITEARSSTLLLVTTKEEPKISFVEKERNKSMTHELEIAEKVSIKGRTSIGNRISKTKVRTVKLIGFKKVEEPKPAENTVSEETEEPKKDTLF
jgi:topoisomerase-4 subunit A